MSRGDSERAFRAARRHSRTIRILRVAVPSAVVVVTVVIVAMTYFNPLRMFGKLPVDIGHLVVSGTKITMEQPHLSGFTNDARAYEFTAAAAAQDMTKPDIIELHNIRAKMQMQDKSSVQMTALSGVYDSKGETLKLNHDIRLSSSNGYRGKLSEAIVDVRKGNVASDHPVRIEMLQGTLDANRLRIVDQGDLIRFEGGVHMDMLLNDAAKPAQQQATAHESGARRP